MASGGLDDRSPTTHGDDEGSDSSESHRDPDHVQRDAAGACDHSRRKACTLRDFGIAFEMQQMKVESKLIEG